MNNSLLSQIPAAKTTASQLLQDGQQQRPEGYQPIQSDVNQANLIQQAGLITNPQYFKQQIQGHKAQLNEVGCGQSRKCKSYNKVFQNREYSIKEVTEYVTQEVVEYVPERERLQTIMQQNIYIGGIYRQLIKTMTEYVSVEKVKERTKYQPMTRQSVIQQPVDYQQIQTTQYNIKLLLLQIQYVATRTINIFPHMFHNNLHMVNYQQLKQLMVNYQQQQPHIVNWPLILFMVNYLLQKLLFMDNCLPMPLVRLLLPLNNILLDGNRWLSISYRKCSIDIIQFQQQ